MHHALAALKAAIAVAGRRARNRLPDEGQATEEHQKDGKQLAHASMIFPG